MQHILNTLAFFASNKGLQSFSKTNAPTRRAIKSLEKRGYLKVSWDTNTAEYTRKI